MPMEWNDDLLLGIPELDEQHQEIFRRLVAFAEACDGDGNTAALQQSLFDLENLVWHHFVTEERLMTASHYPGLDEQQRHHAGFQTDLAEMAARLKEGASPQELSLSSTARLLRWLFLHINELDRRMVEFVRAQQPEGGKSI